jgi:uncharacterized protein YndB with AHSA1/START domain
MDRKIQSQASVIINAPRQRVWDYCMDISKIPEFHPRVSKVDFLSGKTIKEEGVSYQCNITQGENKGTCIEKIIKIVPMEKFTTAIPEESWGLVDLFENYTVDTVFESISENQTKVSILHFYDTNKLRAKLINFFAKGKVSKQTLDTLNGIKEKLES